MFIRFWKTSLSETNGREGTHFLSEKVGSLPHTLSPKRGASRWLRCRVSELHGVGGEVFLDHEGYLKDNSVVELAEVEACKLLDLVESVNESVSVNEELAGSLGHVKIVLEESLDREQRLVVEGLDRTLLEYFLQECLAESGGEMIDKSRDTEVVVAYYVLFGVEYLADLDSYLRLLERARQILHADNGSADTDIHAGEELGLERVRDGAGKLLEILDVDPALYFLYKNYLALGDVEYEVLVLVREEVLYNVIRRYVVGRDDADKEYYAVDVGIEMQLAGLDRDIAREDVVEDDVLYEVVAVVFLVIVLLYARKGDSEDRRVLARHFVGALNEYRVIRLNVYTERLVGVTVADEDIVRVAELDREEIIRGADLRQLAARDNSRVLIDNADNSADGISHLVNYSLE